MEVWPVAMGVTILTPRANRKTEQSANEFYGCIPLHYSYQMVCICFLCFSDSLLLFEQTF